MFAVRTATRLDLPALTTAWHEAGLWRPEELETRPSIDDAKQIADLARYLWDPSCPHELAVVAEVDGVGVGGAWTKRFTAATPGYGFVDEATPELGIGVARPHRGHGIGRALLAALLVEAGHAGHPRLSLSVERDNPSRHLYAQLGFTEVASHVPDDDAMTMVRPTRARQ